VQEDRFRKNQKGPNRSICTDRKHGHKAEGPKVSLELARYYWKQLQDIHMEIQQTGEPTLDHLLHIPHIYEVPETVVDGEALQAILATAVTEALDQVQRMRSREGESLLRDFLNRLSSLEEDLSVVRDRSGTVVQEYKNKLEERLKQLMGGGTG